MTGEKQTLNQWLRALNIAKILFEDQGYHTRYLQQIEVFLKNAQKVRLQTDEAGREN